MKYVCTHCGSVVEADEAPARCPTCLRKHGLIPEDDRDKAKQANKAAGPASSNKRLIIIAAAASLLLGAGLGVWLISRHSKNHGSSNTTRVLGRMSAARLVAALKKEGTPDHTLPFDPDQAIAKWAAPLKKGAIRDTATALLQATRKMMDPDGSIKAAEADHPGSLLTAKQVLAAGKGDDEASAQSYAMAAFVLAAARSLGLRATMIEIYAEPGHKGPLDDTGRLGRFGVALFAQSFSQKKPDAVIDPLLPKLDQPTQYALLDDLSALGAYLNLKAQQTLMTNQDPTTTAMLARAAAHLAPTSPSVQCGRSTMLLAVGGLQPGLSAAHKALGLHDDPPRHMCLAQAYLATGRPDQALTELRTATTNDPNYAIAWVEQARIMMSTGQAAKIQELLDRADQAHPGLWDAKVLRAMLPAIQGNPAKSAQQLSALLSQRPTDLRVFFYLWQLYETTGNEDQADALTKTFTANLPAAQRPAVLARIQQAKQALAKMKAQAAKAASASGAGAAPGGPAGPGIPGAAPSLPTSPGATPPPPPKMDFKLKAPSGPVMGPGPGASDRYKLNY
ncbi:MAG: tetratricopeptide repeat protein [Deltaproteobacteria bacterium]|nr:tetratricopeptide repeat protein [Deltaproteobacteria bacterium]